MKRTMKQKTMLNALLVVFFIGMTLSGCTTDPQNLYEQFLNNEIPVIINNDLEDGYTKYIFKESGSYTLAELSTYVSNFFLNPEYTDKTSCDDIQYAYVECPDSSDENARNLLIKFVGLNFHYLSSSQTENKHQSMTRHFYTAVGQVM